MKLGSINFPDDLIRAIRKEELVVFAGAGVSMGTPAKLPSYPGLAEIIARETGEKKTSEKEPEDQFFGRLNKKGIQVLSLVEKALYTPPGSATQLHRNLLRLFRSASKVRIVTTNFDLLFEEASNGIFGESTGVYKSPALPLGRDFTGVVHVHGSLDKSEGMVLNDADFGRAYLTEGWARRFLIDMFSHYTVLFAGYSHDDVVMHYLSRALPFESAMRRYALVANDTNLGEWLFRGINPVTFEKPSEDDYSILDDGVRTLADYVSQNLLDRRKSLIAIASGMPPSDDEGVDQIVDALDKESTTRFVLQAAREPAWIIWLDSRKYLDPLFKEEAFTAKDGLLAEWLVSNFALKHPRELILLISRHQMNVGSYLWHLLGREICLNEDAKKDRLILSIWISLLLATMPKIANEYILLSLAERCSATGDMNGTLAVFGKMLSHRLEVKEEIAWPREETKKSDEIKLDVDIISYVDKWYLNEIYTKHIKPLLNQLSLPLLSISIRQMEARHAMLVSWGKSNENWDRLSFRRSAIEPHKQNRIQHDQDIFIDAARDSLVAIGESNPSLSDCWLDTLSKSDTLLVQRLFIHGLSERQDKSADDKLRFFLDRHELHDIHAHHEIYHLVANLYPGLSGPGRSELIDHILAYEWMDRSDERFAELTARNHFSWLQWLIVADPACKLAMTARDKIIAEYPNFRAREHPDFAQWSESGWAIPTSPFSVEQLLEKSASQWTEALLVFKGDDFLGPDRNGLRITVREAAKKDVDWGLDLAKELGNKSEWGTDLWRGLLESWEEWSINEDLCLSILKWLRTKELWEHNLYQITRTLLSLVDDGGKDCSFKVLDEANRVAMELWTEVEKESDIPDDNDDWSQLAINKASGVLAEFWLSSIELWRKGRDPKPEILNDDYRGALSQILLPGTKASGLSLTILASRLAFLLSVDYDWTKEHLLECFDSNNDSRRFQQSWDGFLTWGTLNPQVVNDMEPYLEKAINRLDHELKMHRDRFIEYFAVLVCFYVSDPLERWIPAFFLNTELQDRKIFASQVDYLLRGMAPEQRQELWGRWIKRYWERRLQRILQPLVPEEIAEMAEWVLHLDTAFEEAVEIAVQMPPAEMGQSSVIYDLRQSHLVSQYPEATVKLLVYFLQAESSTYFWYGLNEILKELDREKVSPDLLLQLDEHLAEKGFS